MIHPIKYYTHQPSLRPYELFALKVVKRNCIQNYGNTRMIWLWHWQVAVILTRPWILRRILWSVPKSWLTLFDVLTVDQSFWLYPPQPIAYNSQPARKRILGIFSNRTVHTNQLPLFSTPIFFHIFNTSNLISFLDILVLKYSHGLGKPENDDKKWTVHGKTNI